MGDGISNNRYFNDIELKMYAKETYQSILRIDIVNKIEFEVMTRNLNNMKGLKMALSKIKNHRKQSKRSTQFIKKRLNIFRQ
jgi:hypothetical protein